MAAQLDLPRHAHALGRYQASWRFADADLRRALALCSISTAWEIYRRDAGPGEVGRAHEEPVNACGILGVDDARRDAVLLWLLDHGTPEVAEAAHTLVRMVVATRRFSADEHGLLQEARDAVSSVQNGSLTRTIGETASGAEVMAPLMSVARAVDRLRNVQAFVEAGGEEVFLPAAGRAFSHYVSAPPGATWALNLALLTWSSPFAGALPWPGLAKRVLFRLDGEPEQCAANLVETVTAALIAASEVLEHLQAELARGRAVLAHLSRNSRAFETWLLVAALGSLTRVQLTRALGLSRAGGDIQARALARAGLIKLGRGGRIDRSEDHVASVQLLQIGLPTSIFSTAAAELDASIAEIDRLLARAPS